MDAIEAERRAVYSDLKTQVDQLLAESTPEEHQSFFANFGISNQHRKQFVLHTMAAAEKGVPKASHPIPHRVHRLWLTDALDPKHPPDYYLGRIARQAKMLGSDCDYIFWHNCDAAVPNLLPHFSDTNIRLQNIASLSPDPKLLAAIQRGVEVRKYVMAGDICKYMILNECGGIYGDLGIDFGLPLINLVRSKDLSLFLDRNLFFQPAFMAAPAKHSVFRNWCDLLLQPEILSAVGLPDIGQLGPGHEIWMHGGVAFTAALILFFDDSYQLLSIPPNRGLLHHESEGSWYRAGNKFGNALLSETSVTHLRWEAHAEYVRSNRKLAAALVEMDPAELLRLIVRRHLSSGYWLK